MMEEYEKYDEVILSSDDLNLDGSYDSPTFLRLGKALETVPLEPPRNAQYRRAQYKLYVNRCQGAAAPAF